MQAAPIAVKPLAATTCPVRLPNAFFQGEGFHLSRNESTPWCCSDVEDGMYVHECATMCRSAMRLCYRASFL